MLRLDIFLKQEMLEVVAGSVRSILFSKLHLLPSCETNFLFVSGLSVGRHWEQEHAITILRDIAMKLFYTHHKAALDPQHKSKEVL